jgi:hypothetical protein
MMRGMRALSGALLTLVCALGLSGCGDQTSSSSASSPDITSNATSNATPGTNPSPATATTASSGAVEPEESPTPSGSPPEPVSTEVVEATPATLGGYRALATGLTAFFVRAEQVEKKHPGADPKSADEVDELLGDVYPDGVDLVVFSPAQDALTVCLTGPADTFMVLAGHGDGIRQTLGPGDCENAGQVRTLDDGDVVVDIDFGFDDADDGQPRAYYRPRVVKGQNLADQIPDLDAFLDVLNRAADG